MASLLLALLAGVTALLLVGAEGPHPDTLPVWRGGAQPDTPWDLSPPDTADELQLGDDDITSGGGLPSGSLRCHLCKRVVKALRSFVVDPNDEAAVARVTHRVCGRLRVGADLCRRLLHHALATIEKALRRHETPAHLCARLRWCPPQP